MTTTSQVESWINAYVHAWQTCARKDIEKLFAEDAQYHEWPYETDWIGRDEIVRGWIRRKPWQKGGWEFEWKILMITGDTAAIGGVGTYRELGTFENLWTVTYDVSGRCVMFRMWNNEIADRGAPG